MPNPDDTEDVESVKERHVPEGVSRRCRASHIAGRPYSHFFAVAEMLASGDHDHTRISEVIAGPWPKPNGP